MIRKLMHLIIAAIMLTGVAVAQDVAVRSDHPDEYVVVKGDTLWDISGRFLDKPWQWPAIWHANPQIENPHLIYPGDVVSLVYIDGVPQLQLRRGGADTVRLSPSIRVTDREAIKAIPFKSIEPFIKDLRIVSPSEYEALPYVISNQEQRMNVTMSDHTYVRGLDAQVGEEYVVARLTSIYDNFGSPPEIRRVEPKDHWKQVPNVWDRHQDMYNTVAPWDRRPKDPVGYELYEVSRVRVAKAGEITVMDVIRDRTEVKPGDVILPVSDMGYLSTFYPSAMDNVPEGLRVLQTSGQRSGVGRYQIVSISGGTNQGIEAGHVFSAFRQGDLVDDRSGYRWGSFSKEAEVRLPDTYDGLVMVFRTFDDISYGMVMGGGSRVVLEYDSLRHPDERL
ncbi:MAG: LysM peptidoglycan-binding domain-containing protein [Xanthomonadales bacterium]|nr:LysM peptidoglycan-binding domain-containing protein [Gammaproteobacteria bacterium]MBT8052867.1 LysM peptidoglycan-binding domain-containing protein [Gammaproteobacteria bacterium]NND55672.1 LysM peptidoglycan-binding domain-containing protein [Xanthomonadales bacterium]NNK49983.1 LysM peptidoglycan-binding domain-containing protein [Xanthomonadales bacterium]